MLNLKSKYTVDFIDDYGHYYVIDGKKYGSVTTVLSIIGGQKTQGLMGWAKKISLKYVSDELKNQIGKDIKINEEFIDHIVKIGSQKPEYEKVSAGDYGTRTHNAIDEYVVSKKLPTDESIMPSFNGFLKFLEEHKFNIVSGDITLGSKQHGFGGRADGIIMDKDGNYSIMDFKTSNHISADYFLQVSAYAACFSEMYGVPLPKICYIIKFSKDKATYQIIEVNNIQKYFEAFLAAKKLKEAIEGIEKNELSF